MKHHTATPLIVVLLVIGLAGCASLPEWSGIEADNPANPHAAGVPYTPPSNPFGTSIEPTSSTLGVDDQSNSITAIYTCPMHPEIHSHTPGTCPECDMTLTLVTPDTKHNDENGGTP